MWAITNAAPIFSVEAISEDEFLAGITDKSDKNLSLRHVTNSSAITKYSEMARLWLSEVNDSIALANEYEIFNLSEYTPEIYRLPNSGILCARLCELHSCTLLCFTSREPALMPSIYTPACITDDGIIVSYPTSDCDTPCDLWFYQYGSKEIHTLFEFKIAQYGEPKQIVYAGDNVFYLSFYTTPRCLKISIDCSAEWLP